MNETNRLQLYLVWLNWLEMASRELVSLEPVQSVPRYLRVEEKLGALVRIWHLRGLRLEPEEHSELLKRLMWAHRTVQFARAAGLQPPEQPLLQWRLRLLLSDWWFAGCARSYVIDEAAPETTDSSLQAEHTMPAVLHAPLRSWWPCLLADSPPHPEA